MPEVEQEVKEVSERTGKEQVLAVSKPGGSQFRIVKVSLASRAVFLRDKDPAPSSYVFISRAPKSHLGSCYSGMHLSRRLQFS
jgi:hypothetical protein